MAGAAACWARCLAQLAPRTDAAESRRLFGAFVAGPYGEARRRYHTAAHLDEMLRHFAAFQRGPHGLAPAGPQRLALELALLFHDAVYDPARGDNEERSAEWFREFWKTCGAAESEYGEVAGQVVEFILATKQHMQVEPQYKSGGDASAAPPTLHVFLDLDLAVLGAESARYREYAVAIREEYSFYSDADYCRGRIAFLRGFLKYPQWYKTMFFFEALEERARENVQQEVESLEKELAQIT